MFCIVSAIFFGKRILIPMRAASLIAVATVCLAGSSASADIVTISDDTVSGTVTRPRLTAFSGVLSNNQPLQMQGITIAISNNIPAGESFQVGDLVGRDLKNVAGAGRIWEYELSLPGDARAGTGFSNIVFNGHAFELPLDNLEGDDQVSWALFLNNDLVPVQTDGPAMGSDWSTYDASLAHAGGSTITDVRVVFTITGFIEFNEWYATRGTLSADYASIPEPQAWVMLCALSCVVFFGRRPHRRA